MKTAISILIVLAGIGLTLYAAWYFKTEAEKQAALPVDEQPEMVKLTYGIK